MMVKLSAMTVDESAGYEISSSGGGGDQEQYIEAGDGDGGNDDAISDGDGDGDGDGDEPEATAEPAESTGWEAEALDRIRQARDHVATMEGCYLAAKEDAKNCKASWEAAVTYLTKVIDDATKPLPLFDRPTATGTTETATDPTDEAWRETPISEIFLGIRGLGAKKREAIQVTIPTLGAFEDLRKKASLDGEPLKTYMPPGVGQEACDQLEEAALNWVSAHFYPADEDEDEDEAGDEGEDDDEGGEA